MNRNGQATKNCLNCQAEFHAIRNTKRYCSAGCREAYNNAKRISNRNMREIMAERIETKREKLTTYQCDECGSSFHVDGTKRKSIYCSGACRQKAYRARKKQKSKLL